MVTLRKQPYMYLQGQSACTEREEKKEGERKTKQNPMQYLRSVTDSITESGLAKKLAEQKGTKYKIILE